MLAWWLDKRQLQYHRTIARKTNITNSVLKMRYYFTLSALLAFFAAATRPAQSYKIAASFNSLLFYNNDAITNSNFTADIANGTTFGLAAAIRALDGQSLAWLPIYQHAKTTLSNIGWISQSMDRVNIQKCSQGGVTLEEVVASTYQFLGGTDAEDLAELLQLK